MMNAVAQVCIDRVLRDGGSIRVRAIRPDDKARLVDHFSRLSARSVYFRFFRVKKRLTDEELTQFTELDFRHRVGLVATLVRDGSEEIVGVGRYAVLDAKAGTPSRAEVAFAVADAHQGRGVASVLLEQLADIARAAGIEEIEADELGENNSMLSVFGASGYRVTRALEDGVFHLTFPTEATPESLAVIHRRERTAAAASIRAFMQPRAVAVVGASERPGSLGASLVAHLLDGGFTGPVYPVHPRAPAIAGRPAYATVSAIGRPVDLAVIAVPAEAVEAVVADCAAAGVRGVVVVSAGFAESGAAGRERQQRLAAAVRAAGMRLVGPNCFGVLNTDPAVSLNATIAPLRVAPGPVAMLSQSGALGFAVLERCARLGIGLSSFVSVGNKADVSGNDLLAYWNEDPRTRVVLLYLESFGNPRKFARVAPEVARRVPIVAVKAGRSPAATRVAAGHSAALAHLDVAVDALFTQAGVMRTDTLAELLEVAALLATQPVPAGPRVGVVTNAGGPAVLFADAAEAADLTLPGEAAGDNPIDLPAARPDDYAAAMARLGAQAAIDAVVAIYVTPLPAESTAFATAIARGAAAVPAAKPVAVVFMTTEDGGEAVAALHAGPRGRLPFYEFPESAARALGAAARYARWRARPAGTVLELDAFARQAVRAVVERTLVGGGVALAPDDLTAILCAAGITCAMGERVTPDEAVAAAERLGYPLAMKAIAPGLVHRRAAGAVLLGLRDAAAVAQGVAELRVRVAGLEAVELQRQIEDGLEALVGVTADPTFGPLVACRIGSGLAARDAAVRLPPVTDVDAEEMLGPLLPSGDHTALADVIRRVSALVDIVPELYELVLEPIKLLPNRRGAVVVGASMRLTPPGAG